MAITGKFIADFSSFQTAVSQAEVSLRSFETGAGKVEASLNKMADSLSGRKIIQDAALMAEAVERIGGTSKLTEAELARVGRTANEATEKMRAMGIDIPPGLQKIATEAKGAEVQTSLLGGSFARFTSAFAVGNILAQGITSLTQWGKEAFSAAARVDDLASKTGLSTDAIQQMAFVAEQTGSSIEGFTQAAFRLGANLGTGSGGVRRAVEELGLSFAELRNQTRDEQFNAITAALGRITDEGERTRLGMLLFGRSWAEVAGAVADGYDKIASRATLMSQETVRAAGRFDDAWQAAKSTIKALVVESVAFSAKPWVDGFQAMARALGFASEATTKARADIELHGAASEEWSKRLKTAEHGIAQLSAAELAQIEVAKSLGATNEELTDTFGLTADEIRVLNERLSEQKQAHASATAEAKRQTEAMAQLTKAHENHINSIGDKLFGADDIKRAADYAEAIGRIENVSNLNAEAQAELADVMRKGNEALIAAGRGTDDLTTKFTAMGLAATQSGREAAAAYELIRAEAAVTAAALAAYNAQGVALASSIKASGTGVWTSDMAVPAAAKSPNVWTSPAGMITSSPGGIRPMASGGPTTEGPAYLHNNEFVVPSGGALVRGGGGGTTVIQLVVDGRVLAEVVNEQNTRTMKVGRKWPAS